MLSHFLPFQFFKMAFQFFKTRFQFFKIVHISQQNFVSGSSKRPPRGAGSSPEPTLGQISYIFIQMYSCNDFSYKMLGKFRFFLKMHWKKKNCFISQFHSIDLIAWLFYLAIRNTPISKISLYFPHHPTPPKNPPISPLYVNYYKYILCFLYFPILYFVWGPLHVRKNIFVEINFCFNQQTSTL